MLSPNGTCKGTNFALLCVWVRQFICLFPFTLPAMFCEEDIIYTPIIDEEAGGFKWFGEACMVTDSTEIWELGNGFLVPGCVQMKTG